MSRSWQLTLCWQGISHKACCRCPASGIIKTHVPAETPVSVENLFINFTSVSKNSVAGGHPNAYNPELSSVCASDWGMLRAIAAFSELAVCFVLYPGGTQHFSSQAPSALRGR